MDTKQIESFVEQRWEESILPSITEYIKIPNESPQFDPDWEANGHMEKAVELIGGWCRDEPIADMSFEVVRLPGRTPLLYMEIPGAIDDTVLLYGHLDKQPEMTGWDEDLGPWTPVLRDGWSLGINP